MVYSMRKYRNYLLGSHFKLYIDHSYLKYLVNKPVLWGIICRWPLLFQEYDFEVIIKPEKNVGPDHLLNIEFIVQGGILDDNLQNVYLFRVTMIDEQLEDITYFLRIGKKTTRLHHCVEEATGSKSDKLSSHCRSIV